MLGIAEPIARSAAGGDVDEGFAGRAAGAVWWPDGVQFAGEVELRQGHGHEGAVSEFGGHGQNAEHADPEAGGDSVLDRSGSRDLHRGGSDGGRGGGAEGMFEHRSAARAGFSGDERSRRELPRCHRCPLGPGVVGVDNQDELVASDHAVRHRLGDRRSLGEAEVGASGAEPGQDVSAVTSVKDRARRGVFVTNPVI